jgi:hypothetical protein
MILCLRRSHANADHAKTRAYDTRDHAQPRRLRGWKKRRQVVHCCDRMTAKVLVSGHIVHVDNRYLAVWVREHGAWKFVAYQPAPIIKS